MTPLWVVPACGCETSPPTSSRGACRHCVPWPSPASCRSTHRHHGRCRPSSSNSTDHPRPAWWRPSSARSSWRRSASCQRRRCGGDDLGLPSAAGPSAGSVPAPGPGLASDRRGRVAAPRGPRTRLRARPLQACRAPDPGPPRRSWLLSLPIPWALPLPLLLRRGALGGHPARSGLAGLLGLRLLLAPTFPGLLLA